MGLDCVHFEYTGGEGGWPGDVPRFLLDVTRINRLGWRARHTSEQAVAMAIEATLEEMAPEAAMQVVILAGGLGTRLGPLTRPHPKPMVPVKGVPYLEHQLRLLARQGLTDIVLLTGYLGEQIEEYFGDGDRMGLRLRYSRELEPLGTGGALRQARPLLEEAFLVIYGDSYLRIDYAAVGRVALTGARGHGGPPRSAWRDQRPAECGARTTMAPCCATTSGRRTAPGSNISKPGCWRCGGPSST